MRTIAVNVKYCRYVTTVKRGAASTAAALLVVSAGEIPVFLGPHIAENTRHERVTTPVDRGIQTVVHYNSLKYITYYILSRLKV